MNTTPGKPIRRYNVFLVCLALCCFVVLPGAALFNFYEIQSIKESAATDLTIETFFEENQEAMDKYVESRINAYVVSQKQKVIDRKFELYSSAEETISSGKHIYGNEKARFTLVEFSDAECPYCKRFHSVPKKVVDSSSGLVNWQWKHLPLPSHNPVATVEAQSMECVSELAGNQAFWVYLHQVFEETQGNGQGAGDLVSLAASIGVDEERFSDCMRQGTHREKISKDLELARSMSVNSTPVTFVVDNHTGKQIQLRGLQKPESIASAVQRLKKEADLAQQVNGSGK